MLRTMMAVALTLTFVGTAAAQTMRPPDNGEIQHAQRLDAEAKALDDNAAKVTTPQGQQRVAEAIARQFKVDDKVVSDLRAKNLGFGEVSITLGLSQELMKKDPSLTQQRAIDKILAQRASGMGWGQIAHSMDLKLGKIVSDVKRADKGVERLARPGKHDKIDKAERDVEKAERHERMEKAEKLEKAGKPEKVEKVQRVERAERVEHSGRR